MRAEPGHTPYDVGFEEAIVRLRRYEPSVTGEANAPVVVVYPFINDPSILDFRPGRSVVGQFLESGFPVSVLEWRDASPIDRSIGLEDVIGRYLHRAVDAVRAEAGTDAVHLLGYSTGAPLAAAYAGRHPGRVETLVLQGPPLDYDAGECVGLLRTLGSHLDLEALEPSFEVVPPEVVEAPLTSCKPVEYTLHNPARLWDRLDDGEYVDDWGRKLSWLVGGPDLPARFYREFIETFVLENRLLNDDLRIDGQDVDLEAIDMPVFALLGREDTFVPRDAVVPFLEAVSSEETTVLEVPTGHVGLSTAPVAHEEGWPAVLEWLEAR